MSKAYYSNCRVMHMNEIGHAKRRVVRFVIMCLMVVAVIVLWTIWRVNPQGRDGTIHTSPQICHPQMEKIADGESADRSLLAAKPADRGVSAPELASEKNQEMDRMLGRRTIPAGYAATMRARRRPPMTSTRPWARVP